MNVRHDMITVFVVRPAGSGHELLQLRRVPTSYMGGTWQTVRGKIKPGETAIQGAVRELKEETGLSPREFYRLPSIESFYTPDDTIWHCPVFFALVAADAAVTLNHEHDAHRWVAWSNVKNALMWPRERQLIVEIEREILHDGLAKPHLIIKL
jgi:dATP pyrophosphohydrolase